MKVSRKFIVVLVLQLYFIQIAFAQTYAGNEYYEKAYYCHVKHGNQCKCMALAFTLCLLHEQSGEVRRSGWEKD